MKPSDYEAKNRFNDITGTIGEGRLVKKRKRKTVKKRAVYKNAGMFMERSTSDRD